MPAIGIDHVQFSVPDLAASTSFLERLGWQLEFREPAFAPTRRPYFREIGKSLAYLKRDRAAIELINGSTRCGSANWTPLFSGRLPGGVDPDSAPAPGSIEVRVDELGTTCLCADVKREAVDLGEVVLSSSQPEASAALLASLGFKRDQDGTESRLSFPPSIIGMSLAVNIVGGPEVSDDVFVDDLGLSLIALITRDLEEEAAALREDGHRVTDVFDYTINGRAISNVIVHGPGGEFIELIQLGRA